VHKSQLILGFVLLAKIAIGQSISTQMGARAAGMGYASSGIKDEWSLFYNPGGLGKITQINTAFAYEVQSQLKSANRMGAVFNRPFKWGTPSLGLFRFGDDLYNEQALSIGFGNQFGIASLGLKANLIQYRAEGFGVSTALSFDFGGITELTQKLSIGTYITNLTQSHIGEDDDRLPTRLIAGLTYNPEKNISITTELSKELGYNTTWRTGLEYSFHQKIFFRTGFNLNPNAGFFGIGAHKKKVSFDYAIQLNHSTGASHQASASYWFSKKGKE
jgi:hypothetical protein